MLNKSKVALAFSLILSSYSGVAETLIEYDKISLTPGNVESLANKVSEDGGVIAGYATDENYVSQAVIWRGRDRKMINLGTLKADNSGSSLANAVSADGHVIVGESVNDAGYHHAFIWRDGDQKMTDLGTLKADNSGSSRAIGVSADGRVVVGNADNDTGHSHAFIWRENDQKMTDLGTLKADNSGNSFASAVSADGRVVVGEADNGVDRIGRAFIWREGDSKMADLGTLKADNSGNSRANGVSADGRVVVGNADNDEGLHHAFIWREGDQKVTSLGTLKADNSGSSLANAVSADGSIVVGWAESDESSGRAFIWREDDQKMTDLGTLKADNSGTSSATGVSADGTVVVGGSETDDGTVHATVWKVKGPSSTIVDATNSSKAMSDTGRRGFKVLDLYQSSLNSLSQSRCQLGQSDYCVGAFTQYDSVSSNHRTATGLFGALRLPAENWIVGGAMNFATSTDLIDNYDTRGSHQPGVGMFIRYQQNRDNTGFNAELSGAFLQQDLTITRDQLENTEAGQGNSRIKGYQASLSARYGYDVTPSTLVSPEVALTHHKVTRDGYTETRHAEFAGTYEKMGNTRTDLQVGINAVHQLDNTIQLDGNIGANVKLHSERDAFVGYIPYIGAYAYDAGDERTVRPFVSAGINVNVTKNSTVRANVGWQQTDYQHDAANVGLSYSYHW